MRKKGLYLALATVVLSTVLASCSVGGSGSANPQPTQHPVRSYSEKVSYYDALVAGDSDPIPLTTALNNSISIEGDPNLLDEEVYQKVVEIANEVFPRVRSKYSSGNMLAVTITLDASSAGYTACYTVGNMVLLNTDWLNNHPNECDVLIEGFASVILQFTKKDETPAWLIEAMKLYVRDEFALYRADSSFSLPKRYNGKSYESDSLTATAFLKWIRNTQNVDIVERLNRQCRSIDGYQAKIWLDATGKTLDQLWNEYKNA